MSKVKIGTRGSKLALWQAEFVAEMLKDHGLDPEIMVIETRGDRVLDVSISKIGSKGVFTEELEEQLLSGETDIAVHSAKDLQSSLDKDFQIIAFTKREKVNDVLISHKSNVSLSDKNILVGTSSTRRVATLKHYYPHVKTVSIRGNLQTRIRKMEEGQCDALLLAFAGVYRMGYHHMIRQELDIAEFTPAVGQGSLAIEASVNMDPKLKEEIRKALNHQVTEYLLLAERAYLKELEGGCSIPAFALGELIDGNDLRLSAGLFSLDGKTLIHKMAAGPFQEAEKTGYHLAKEVLSSGGAGLLKEIRKELSNE